ncbi:MAG: hypothetical protein K1V80_02955 [Muribaculaceae bacterium]|uniref:DUF6712 family protein n=1 Tax=uncultured Muribaculum sp. TaxID=1918613 RepID=UPI0026EA0D21|nr:DUF6712 family protein [uncultured Muribaculum sp.]
MILMLDNERLQELIPNVIHEVKGETLLYNKLRPWLEQAKAWLEQHFLGDLEPEGQILCDAEKIIVYKAFAMAVPSLDLSLSPSGFTVINTDGRAPASKERVERLIASINSFVDQNLDAFVFRLYSVPAWRTSNMGQWWLATFIPNLNEVWRYRGMSSDTMTTYRIMRSHALRFEQEVEENYLGSVLDELRAQQYYLSEFTPLVSKIREAELRYIGFHMRDQKAKCPDEHEVWHLIRPVLEQMKSYPDIYTRWQAEIGHRMKPEPFKNDVKGGYYF